MTPQPNAARHASTNGRPKRDQTILGPLTRYVPHARCSPAVSELGESDDDWRSFLRRVYRRLVGNVKHACDERNAPELQLVWELAVCYWRHGRLLVAENAGLRGSVVDDVGEAMTPGTALRIGAGALEGFEEQAATDGVDATAVRDPLDDARRAALAELTAGKVTKAIGDSLKQRQAIIDQLRALRDERRADELHAAQLELAHAQTDAAKAAARAHAAEKNTHFATRPGGLAGGPARGPADSESPAPSSNTAPPVYMSGGVRAHDFVALKRSEGKGRPRMRKTCRLCGLPRGLVGAYPECRGRTKVRDEGGD